MGKYIEYLRKSQMDRDYETLSVEETLSRHRVILADFVKSRNLNVDIVLEEVVSGEALSSRPQMLKLLELVNTGEYDGVICMDIDRLSRGSSVDSGYIMQILQLNDCKIITPQKTYDLTNETDEQFADMKFMFSRYELQTIRKRLNRGKHSSIKEGKYNGSVAPYGYNIVKIKGEKGNTLEIREDEAQFVRMIFDWYTVDRLGTGQIAMKLDDLHVPPRNVPEWSSSTIRQILINEHYIGKVTWGRKPVGKKFINGQLVKKVYRSKDYELHDGRHEAIISDEQFALAQKIRRENNVTPTKRDNEVSNPLGGVLVCGHCGQKMRRATQPNKPNTKPRFKCLKAKKCGCKSHIQAEVEQAIVQEMRKWLAGYVLSLDHDTVPEDDGLDAALEVLSKRLEDLYEQQDTICDLYEKKEYSERLFKKRNAALEAEIDKVQIDIEDLEDKMSQRQEETAVQLNIIPHTQYLLDNYEDLTAKEKNDIWREIVEKITFRKTEKGGQFHIEIFPKLPYKTPQTH